MQRIASYNPPNRWHVAGRDATDYPRRPGRDDRHPSQVSRYLLGYWRPNPSTHLCRGRAISRRPTGRDPVARRHVCRPAGGGRGQRLEYVANHPVFAVSHCVGLPFLLGVSLSRSRRRDPASPGRTPPGGYLLCPVARAATPRPHRLPSRRYRGRRRSAAPGIRASFVSRLGPKSDTIEDQKASRKSAGNCHFSLRVCVAPSGPEDPHRRTATQSPFRRKPRAATALPSTPSEPGPGPPPLSRSSRAP
jgi:hypothetical protein